MVIPDYEQREHLVREGEQTSRSGMALLQSHRATCGDVPRTRSAILALPRNTEHPSTFEVSGTGAHNRIKLQTSQSVSPRKGVRKCHVYDGGRVSHRRVKRRVKISL